MENEELERTEGQSSRCDVMTLAACAAIQLELVMMFLHVRLTSLHSDSNFFAEQVLKHIQ